MHRSATSRAVVSLIFLTMAAVIAPRAVGVAAGLGVIEPPVSGASAEVIAQGLVTFDDGEFHWTLASLAVNRTLAPVGSESPEFLLAGGPVAVLVSSSDGAGWRLGPGEAVFQPEDSASDAMALAEGAAALTTISVDRGPGAGQFAPGAGVRDVDLVRGQLPPAGSLTMHAEVSALVYVSLGQVQTEDTTIAAGATTIRDGDVMLVNNTAEPATVVVAVIGQSVDLSGANPGPSETSAPTDAPPSADAPQPAPAPAPTAPPATAPTTTVDQASIDVDQDGLTGADEELRGTDADDSDSDDDGLSDGAEVFETGTSPTVADSDGDEASDGQEVDAGTNPNLDEDSDGDGVPDSDEILSGGDPFDPTDQP